MVEAETIERDFTLAEWRAKRRISSWKFYEMQKNGTGPEVWCDGKVKRISAQADREWEERARERARNPTKEQLKVNKLLRIHAHRAARRSAASPKHVARRAAAGRGK